MSDKKYYGDSVNAKNMAAINAIKNINGKYADHMFYKNRIVEAIAKSFQGGIDILSKPICSHCEKPGQWHCDFRPSSPNPNPDCIDCMEMQEAMKETAGKLIEVHGEITSPDYGHIGCCWCENCGKTTFAISMKQYMKEQLNVTDQELIEIYKEMEVTNNETNRAG